MKDKGREKEWDLREEIEGLRWGGRGNGEKEGGVDRRRDWMGGRVGGWGVDVRQD